MLLLALQLAGCGYHLRGNRADAPALLPVAVSAPPSAQLLVQQLYQRLSGRGWAGNVSDSQAIIQVLEEKIERQTGSLTLRGLASEYRVNYNLRYEVLDHQGNRIQPARQISYQRLYRFEPTQAAAMTWQERRLEQTMRGLAIDEVMRSLAHIKAPTGGQTSEDLSR